jgi:hypothetical protein
MPEPVRSLTFRDREREIKEIVTGPSEGVRARNFYGEAGIGKSRLLVEGAASLQANPSALVLHVDLAGLAQLRDGRPLALLKVLAEQTGISPVLTDDSDAAAAQIVDYLSVVGGTRQVTMLVDTTESLQDDTGFWQWFEKHVLSPLVSEGNILVVLAGRLPAPLRLVEVRRHLRVTSLEPLPVSGAASELVREVLEVARCGAPTSGALTATEWDTELEEKLTDIALAFSHGHPLLSQKIALYLADPVHREPADSLRRRVAEEVVGPFIEKEFFPFKPEMTRWQLLMKWASALDWFDATVFYRFDVAMSGSQRSETEWQYEFVKAMAQLRSPYAVVTWQDEGYTLVGTVKSIVASYMQAAQRDEYRKALRAAAKVFNQIADEYFTDSPQAGEPYRKAAWSYEQRLELEVQHGIPQ